MEICLSFFKLSEKYPEENRSLLVAYNKDELIGAQALKTCRFINMENKNDLWWAYFDFQPERLSEKTPKGEAIVRTLEET